MLGRTIDYSKPSSGGGGGGGAINIDIAQETGVSTTKVMSQDAVTKKVLYSNSTPVPVDIGGVKAGTVYNNEPVVNIIDKILHPYQAPSFSSFTVNGQASITLEVGTEYPGGLKTFNWSINNPNNIKPNSITLNNETGLANTGTKQQNTLAAVKNTVGSHVFTIKAIDTLNKEINRTITINWLMKRYWGVSPLEEVTDDDIKAMSQELSSNRVKTVTYDGTGGMYPYFIYPTAFGDLNNTKVGPLDWNDWVLVKRSFININGVSIPMNIYRGFNKINGSLTINWG